MTGITRRTFIQLSVVSTAVAAAGCAPQSRYDPDVIKSEVAGRYGGYDNRVYPYIDQPDGMEDGVPQYFATTCRMCAAGCGLFVRTMGGRAIKIEGNPAHPVNHGGTCARGQAALQHLYNPDRLRFPAVRARGQAPARVDWDTALRDAFTRLQGAAGSLAVIIDQEAAATSPTLSTVLGKFSKAFGATVFGWSVIDDFPWRAAIKEVYGQDHLPVYRIDLADTVVSIGGNFLETWPSPVMYGRMFGEFRQGARRAQGEHGRFIYIGPRMSMTAAKADTWIPCTPGSEKFVALGLLTALGGAGIPVAEAANLSGISVETLSGVAAAMKASGPRAVAMGGDGISGNEDSTAAFAAVESLNVRSGSECVRFGTTALPKTPPAQSGVRGMQSLATGLNGGRFQNVLIVGQANPLYAVPPSMGLSAALGKAKSIVAITPFEDDTTELADVLLPSRAFLEEWGDHVPRVAPDGDRSASLIQPVIDPQFIGGAGSMDYGNQPAPWMDTRPTIDLLLSLMSLAGHEHGFLDGRDAVRNAWAGIGHANLAAPGTDNDPAWIDALSQGGAWANAPAAAPRGKVPATTASAFAGQAPPGRFSLLLYPQLYRYDGRHANLGFMQEIPDPMSMAVWNSWVEINLQTAEKMGIRTGDIVRLTSQYGSFEAPALPYPALHPDTIAMPLGQGHTGYGRNASKRGVNPLALIGPQGDSQTGALAYNGVSVTLEKIRDAVPMDLVTVQDRPGGAEPEAVQDLIQTTAREWKQARPVTGAPLKPESIFNRDTGGKTAGE